MPTELACRGDFLYLPCLVIKSAYLAMTSLKQNIHTHTAQNRIVQASSSTHPLIKQVNDSTDFSRTPAVLKSKLVLKRFADRGQISQHPAETLR